MSKVTVAAIQCKLPGPLEHNVGRVTELVREAASKGARIILPPELFEGPYFCREERDEFFSWARPAKDHPPLQAFQRLAETLGVAIPVSFFERDGQGYYNSI